MRFVNAVVILSTLSLTACNIVLNQSNDPDSGVDCVSLAVDAGGVDRTVPSGSGTLTGPTAFTVQAAYQRNLSSVDTDGGRTSTWLQFSLYANAHSCADLSRSDAGSVGPVVAGSIFDPHLAYAPGSYPIVGQSPVDGGYSTIALFTPTAPDGGLELASAVSGAVTLSQLASCSLNGSFDATFQYLDGGTTSLSGAFSSAFCR